MKNNTFFVCFFSKFNALKFWRKTVFWKIFFGEKFWIFLFIKKEKKKGQPCTLGSVGGVQANNFFSWPNQWIWQGVNFACILEQNAPHFRQLATQISACVVFTMRIKHQLWPHDKWTENYYAKVLNEFAPQNPASLSQQNSYSISYLLGTVTT